MALCENEGPIRPLQMTRMDEGRETEQKWHPTHLRVTVLRACALRPKGSAGASSNPYVVIQLQKQKFRTSVASHSLSPEWHEECLLRLPSVLDDSEEHSRLTLTVMHQSLHHFNHFLGRVSLPLAQLFQDKTKRKNEWFVLQSRQGKKEKMRGQLQLDVQFLQISSPSNKMSFSSHRAWPSLFTRFCGSRKGRKYKEYKETQSQSSSMTNEEASSSSSMITEPEISAAQSGPEPGSSLCTVAAAIAGRKPMSPTQGQKLTSYNYKERSFESINLEACSSSVSQSEHPDTLEQFGSIFTQLPMKKSKPLKEERSPEAAGIATAAWQASLPPLHSAGPSKIPPRAQTLHLSAVSLHQTPNSLGASSTTSLFHRCQLRLQRSYHSCLRCFGLHS